MKTLGLIVNPVAGMGGAVGLKGTDGQATLRKAISLGAKPIAPARAELFLSRLKATTNRIHLLAAVGNMGAYEAQKVGLTCRTIGEAEDWTNAEDTKSAAHAMMREGVDLLVFCGGDGTARDLLDAVDKGLPALGVPTGVKMHSAVFAFSPESAAETTVHFLSGEIPLRESEVMDVDEEAFRDGRLSARLYGYMLVPYEPESVQTVKAASPTTGNEVRNQAAIAIYIIEEFLESNVIYILGPGTTIRTIADLLDAKKTLLGVDLLCNRKIIARDVNEKRVLEEIRGKKARIVVTPIGGQGFIFGRGNQQISSSVIRKVGRENITVVATKHKLKGLKSLRVDTGDPKLDEELRGQMKVIFDYKEERAVPVE
ncbi:MAG: ATP-NAD kinase family protein [Candidatus Bathyarchaeota archaeon]|nr:ATP-NAD kinase family protein [Candidatus Bathyarchaeota archaeon]